MARFHLIASSLIGRSSGILIKSLSVGHSNVIGSPTHAPSFGNLRIVAIDLRSNSRFLLRTICGVKTCNSSGSLCTFKTVNWSSSSEALSFVLSHETSPKYSSSSYLYSSSFCAISTYVPSNSALIALMMVWSGIVRRLRKKSSPCFKAGRWFTFTSCWWT